MKETKPLPEEIALPLSNQHQRYLALFDFDGTITDRDSMLAFLRYSHSATGFIIKSILCTPVLCAFALNIISNEKAKELILKRFFQDWNEAKLTEIGQQFSTNELDSLVRKLAIKRILAHLTAGHDVVVVSASLTSWLQPWCENNNLDIIATLPKFSDTDKFIGINGKNCYGNEKAIRICERYTLKNYTSIYAYGDSAGDNEMLNLAHIKHFKPFRSSYLL